MQVLCEHEAVCNNFNILEVCTHGQYVQKFITKYCTCEFIDVLSFIIYVENYEGK
jgi:hypothetical protein